MMMPSADFNQPQEYEKWIITYHNQNIPDRNHMQELVEYFTAENTAGVFLFMGISSGAALQIVTPSIKNGHTGGCSSYYFIFEKTMADTLCLLFSSSVPFHVHGPRFRERAIERWQATTPSVQLLEGANLRASKKAHHIPQGLHLLAGSTSQSEYTPLFSFHTENWPASRDFSLRSMSKSIVACVCLIAQERGLLHIDDPVIKYIPSFTHYEKIKVTLRMILTHTSGFPSGKDDDPEMCDLSLTLAQVADRISKRELVAAPGTKFIYSNLAFQLAGAVLEVATGKSFREFLDEVLAKPLGISSLKYYNWTNKTDVTCYGREPNVSVGQGAFLSTEDMSIFLQMLSNGGEVTLGGDGDGEGDGGKPRVVRILSQESVDEMLRPQVSIEMFNESSIFPDIVPDYLKMGEIFEELKVIPPEMMEAVSEVHTDFTYCLGLLGCIHKPTGTKVNMFCSSTGSVAGIANACVSTRGNEGPAVVAIINVNCAGTLHQLMPLEWCLKIVIDQVVVYKEFKKRKADT
jgi:hypothetical protein